MNRSYSERTHGTRLRRLQDLVLQLSTFVNYDNPHPEDSLAELTTLSTQLQQRILDASTAEINYRLATEERQNAFYKDKYSVTKVLKYLRAMVVVDSGKQSRTGQMIAQLIRDITPRSRKKSDPALGAAASGEVAPTRSQAHTSFASKTLTFREIVELLGRTNYRTNVPELQHSSLLHFAQHLTQLNNNVSQTAVALEDLRRQRDALLLQADTAVQRVKNCVKYLYGMDSNEYLALKPI